MSWFAIRRSQSSSLRDEAGPVSGIPHGPPHPGQLIPQLISPSKVLRRPSLLPFLHQLLSPLVALSTLLRLGKGAEPDELKHLPHHLSRRTLGNLAPIRFSDQLKHLGERPWRIEVISESLAKRFES